MLVRDILKLKGDALYSIAPEARVSEAVALMARHDIGSLVVTQAGRMAGMLTFREVLKVLAARQAGLDDLTVGGIMTADPVTVGPDESVDHLRELMIRHHARYVPVMDRSQLAGVLSFHDVARAVIRETSFENRLLRRYIEESGS